MNKLAEVFEKLDSLTSGGNQIALGAMFKNLILQQKDQSSSHERNPRQVFLENIIAKIDVISYEINKDESILVSVKNQKLLRTCFQLITSLGIAACLIPGVGISRSKRSSMTALLPQDTLDDEEKYKLLIICTEFFTRSYAVPVLKNIIITFYLSDYLAALIQLSYAPIKKTGIYEKFTMTENRFNELQADRQRFIEIYNELVINCFQPTLMKELLVLQGVTNPPPPAFVKRTVSRELSKRLLTPGGLLSLTRCFIESFNMDAGYEWKKIDIICKIVCCQHGHSSKSDYLDNICTQILKMLTMNNSQYLTTAVACALNLHEKFPQSASVTQLINKLFQSFEYEYLNSKHNLPGTLVLSPQEVEHNINVLHACMGTMKLNWPIELILPNLFLLLQFGLKCQRNQELRIKISNIIMKCMEACNEEQMFVQMRQFLFGSLHSNSSLSIEEFEAGLAVKYGNCKTNYPKIEALAFYLELLKTSLDDNFIETTFTVALRLLIDLTVQRERKGESVEGDPEILDEIDHQYALILQLLTEISTLPKVMSSLKKNSLPVLSFIEFFLLKKNQNHYEECVTIALVLLNTILSNCDKKVDLQKRYANLIPCLKRMAHEKSLNNILCKEALSLISSETPVKVETSYEKAVSDVFDNLLPVRTHGIIELTKLIDQKDPETLSKKHYLFCLFKEQLKDVDSYIYLAAINGIASLGTHCTEDVLQLLCNEFLQVSSIKREVHTLEKQNNDADLHMKIGDIIVKVTKRLGEMAIVHKTLLLNTMLSACRDDDPFIRTSALSNLAEIALVLHYKIGSIIYEVLSVVWNILATDKAIECRRAAVMVISSLLKGLDKNTLLQLKENLLPIYRTLKSLYSDESEDNIVRLHSQLALEELNDIVTQFLFPEVKLDKRIYVLDKPEDIFK